jgi:hypothetical protein
VKIKITHRPPVEQRHGLVEGLELEVVQPPKGKKAGAEGWWVIAPGSGEAVKVLRHEAERLA